MIRYQPTDVVDFVVIGSGAAGGVVAKELSTAGFSVVVMEQGPYLKEKTRPMMRSASDFNTPSQTIRRFSPIPSAPTHPKPRE